MRVHRGTPHTFLNEFHTAEISTDVAILVLSDRRRDLHLFEGLIEGRIELDRSLGEGVSLYLFQSETEHFLRRGDDFLPGEQVIGELSEASNTWGARDFFSPAFLGPDGRADRAFVRQVIAEDTASIAEAFCAALGLPSDQMPVVCILAKGVNDALYFPAGDRLSFEKMVRIATRVRDALTRAYARAAQEAIGYEGLRREISRAENGALAAAKATADLEQRVRRIENKFRVILIPQVRALIKSSKLDAENFRTLLTAAAGPNAEELVSHSLTQASIKFVARWRTGIGEPQSFARRHAELNLLRDKRHLEALDLSFRQDIRAAMVEEGVSAVRLTDAVKRYAVWGVKLAPAVGAISKGLEIVRQWRM